MIGDLLALESWSDRAHWLKELAFPSESYMRGKYPNASKTWLPILYARRGIAGIAGLIFPGRADHGD